jgi:hypothetical protein
MPFQLPFSMSCCIALVGNAGNKPGFSEKERNFVSFRNPAESQIDNCFLNGMIGIIFQLESFLKALCGANRPPFFTMFSMIAIIRFA